jgi:hypothetical protein
MMSPACFVYTIDTLWILQLNCKSHNFTRGIFRKPWKGCICPQGCVDVVIVGSIAVIPAFVGILSHDMGGSGKVFTLFEMEPFVMSRSADVRKAFEGLLEDRICQHQIRDNIHPPCVIGFSRVNYQAWPFSI